MKGKFRVLLALSMAFSLVLVSAIPGAAAKKVALSTKKATIKAGASKKITVKNTKKKVKWSIKSGKKYISLKKKKKNSVVVQGKKAGKAVVLAKVGGKKLTCNVTVKKKAKNSEEEEPDVKEATAEPSASPAAPVTPSAAPTQAATPVNTPVPSPTQSAEPTAEPTNTPQPTEEPLLPGEFRYEGLDRAWIAENIDPEKPVVAMSFDDGPGSYNSFVDYGMQIQQALKDAGAHATFFYIGSHIQHDDQSRAEVQQALDWGFEIANHSWDTSGLNSASVEVIQEKISKTNAVLQEISGYENFLFRAPNVAYSKKMEQTIQAPFIDVSCWSNDYQSDVDKDKIVENVTKAKDGDIINMHSVHEKTAQAVPEILAYFKEQGIQVVSVSELFAIKGQPLMIGQKYYKCEAASE